MADRTLDILIKFGLDPSQAKAAIVEMEKLGQEGVRQQEKVKAATEATTEAVVKQTREIKFLTEQITGALRPTASSGEEGLGASIPGSGEGPTPPETPGGGTATSTKNILEMAESVRDEAEAHARNVVELAKEYQARLLMVGATDAQIVKAERMVASAEGELKIIQKSASEQQSNAALVRAGAAAKEIAAMASKRMAEIDENARDAADELAQAQKNLAEVTESVSLAEATGDPARITAKRKQQKEVVEELVAAEKRLAAAQQAQSDSSGVAIEKTNTGLKKAHGHTQGLRRALGMLTGQFGELGHVAHIATYGMMAAGLGAVAVAIKIVVDKFKEYNATLDRYSENSARAMGASRLQLVEIAGAHDQANAAFKRQQEQLAITYQETSKQISHQITLQKQAAQVAEAAALALVKDGPNADRERAAIELKYNAINRGIENQEKLLTIKAKEVELGDTINAQKKLEADSAKGMGGRNIDAAADELKKREITQAALARSTAFAESEKAIWEKHQPAPMGASNKEILDALERRNSSEMTEREKGILDLKLQEAAVKTKEILAAKEAELRGRKSIEDLKTGIKLSEDLLETTRKRAALESEIDRLKKNQAAADDAGKSAARVEAMTKLYPTHDAAMKEGKAAIEAQAARALPAAQAALRAQIAKEERALDASKWRRLRPDEQTTLDERASRIKAISAENKRISEMRNLEAAAQGELGEKDQPKTDAIMDAYRRAAALKNKALKERTQGDLDRATERNIDSQMNPREMKRQIQAHIDATNAVKVSMKSMVESVEGMAGAVEAAQKQIAVATSRINRTTTV